MTPTERLPFRPVQTVDEISFVIGPAGEVEVDIRTGRKVVSYDVEPLHSGIGGSAFKWRKLDGSREAYNVLCHGDQSSCDCKGWCLSGGGCKHLQVSFELLEQGVLSPAPVVDLCDLNGGDAPKEEDR